MRQKQLENGESSPDIYSTPILSERPPSSAARSIHNESLHQIALSNHHQNRAGVKPVSSIPSGLQLHGNSHSNGNFQSFSQSVPELLRNYPYGSRYLLPVMYRAALSRNSHIVKKPAASIAPFLRLGKVEGAF